MKDRVDKSMGIVTRIEETLTRNTSGNSPVKILASRCACMKCSRAKSSYTRPEVITVIGRKTKGSGLSVYI